MPVRGTWIRTRSTSSRLIPGSEKIDPPAASPPPRVMAVPGLDPICANLTEPSSIVASVVRSSVRVLYCKVSVPTWRRRARLRSERGVVKRGIARAELTADARCPAGRDRPLAVQRGPFIIDQQGHQQNGVDPDTDEFAVMHPQILK